jgi:hypothetical protein
VREAVTEVVLMGIDEMGRVATVPTLARLRISSSSPPRPVLPPRDWGWNGGGGRGRVRDVAGRTCTILAMWTPTVAT